jgi:hypothetical protein
MASIFFKRLKDKYGSENISGGKYQEVIKDILAHNNKKSARAIGRLSNQNYKDSLKKIGKKKATTVKLPDLTEVLPKQSVFLIKGQQNSKLITGTLRDRLQKDLRATLQEFDGTGKKRIEVQRGRTTGKINPELIKSFQDRITKTFEGYTKRDGKTGVPPNISAIAVTEIRSVIDSTREQYNRKLVEKNPQIEMVKTWIHNRSLSKVPRKGHLQMHNKTIPLDGFFQVPRKDQGYDFMSRPHDPDAPADQNIHCNCEAIYKAKIGDVA